MGAAHFDLIAGPLITLNNLALHKHAKGINIISGPSGKTNQYVLSGAYSGCRRLDPPRLRLHVLTRVLRELKNSGRSIL